MPGEHVGLVFRALRGFHIPDCLNGTPWIAVHRDVLLPMEEEVAELVRKDEPRLEVPIARGNVDRLSDSDPTLERLGNSVLLHLGIAHDHQPEVGKLLNKLELYDVDDVDEFDMLHVELVPVSEGYRHHLRRG